MGGDQCMVAGLLLFWVLFPILDLPWLIGCSVDIKGDLHSLSSYQVIIIKH